MVPYNLHTHFYRNFRRKTEGEPLKSATLVMAKNNVQKILRQSQNILKDLSCSENAFQEQRTSKKQSWQNVFLKKNSESRTVPKNLNGERRPFTLLTRITLTENINQKDLKGGDPLVENEKF